MKSNINLMPVPKNIEILEGKFRIDENIKLLYSYSGQRLIKASNRFLKRLSERTGLFLNNPFAEEISDDSKSDFIVKANEQSVVQNGMDESYKLVITSESIILNSNTDIGVIRGFETILQLIDSDSIGYFFQSVDIEDEPRFSWRGLMIDSCRHFIPVEVIKRNIDGMAAVKMNVFHWHLSDDQGFRIECKTFPRLHELGSDEFYYTHKQIEEIIKYADERGIRIMPEFDVPGHATAILTAYPEFASAPGPYELGREWKIFDGTLNPIKEETYIFLEKFFSEMVELFPDEYFHIGGDENNGKQWDQNEDIQRFMVENNIKDNHALQGYFNNNLVKILNALNKKLVGWDEIFHSSIPTNIVIQSWRGKEALIKAVKEEYQTILSNGYYIDLIQPTDFHYLNDPLLSYGNLTEVEKKLILGGEATMWTEMVSIETIDSRIWPRTAAIAERLWSPSYVNDVEEMYKRLEVISYQLEEHGLTHIKNRGMMLRRLTGTGDIFTLQTLVELVEPVKEYKRNSLKLQTQQSPLTRTVDVAEPDAKAAREFRKLVEDYLVSKGRRKDNLGIIKNRLIIWKENHNKLLPIINQSPILQEIEPLSKNLSEISDLGLVIIEHLEMNTAPDEEWRNEAKRKIENTKKPIAQIELMINPAIENLYNYLK